MASINKTELRIAELQSDDVKARKDAARWLGQKSGADAFGPLVTALHDSSWKVRRNAAVALGQIGNREAVEPLISVLSDRTLSVRRAAINAMGALRDVRATDALMCLHSHTQLGPDALHALLQIGAPALLHCCRQRQAESLTVRNLGQETAEKMIRRDADALLKETLSIEEWSGQQRWLILDTVRQVQSTLSFIEIWQLPKFARISDVPQWCERILNAPDRSALHPAGRQVLDYVMLGRASQRDYATEGDELLRAAAGSQIRDTGETLLRASDKREPASAKPSLLGRLRRWLGQEG